jgi:hypothetical protein
MVYFILFYFILFYLFIFYLFIFFLFFLAFFNDMFTSLISEDDAWLNCVKVVLNLIGVYK